MLVLYKVYFKREDKVAAVMWNRIEEEEVWDMARGLFGIVRSKVWRFMMRTGDDEKAELTPMD